MTEIPLTITDAAAAIRSGSTTSVALTEAMLARADEMDPILGVYITRMNETALAAARTADAELANGHDRGPLHGIPIGVKDIIATVDAPTTAQSLVLDRAWGEGIDAPVVSRLREAGAVIVGKTSTMEYAIGMPDASKPFPVPRNPWNPERWPGGSSSGSGAGVAAGLFLGALGTDTGGSIRMPAAFCGISGMKQTFGLVPKSGCVPLGYSRDHIGPMARSARDCATMLNVLAGYDHSDLTSVDIEVPDYTATLEGSMQGLTVGVERAHHLNHPKAEPEAVAAFEAAVEVFAAAGAKVVEVSIPYFDEIVAAQNVASRAESFAYHALDLRADRSLYGVHTKDVLIGGALCTGYEYVQTQRLRTFAKQAIAGMMEEVDIVLTPAALTGAPLVEGLDFNSFMSMPLFTPIWNTLGLPAFCIPMGFSAGLPVSLQMVGRPFEEPALFRAADAYQQRTDWHLQVPPMAKVAMPA